MTLADNIAINVRAKSNSVGTIATIFESRALAGNTNIITARQAITATNQTPVQSPATKQCSHIGIMRFG